MQFSDESTGANEPKLGVAIPAYADALILHRCLDSIYAVSPRLSEVISVVDDSGDGRIASKLADEFPHVRWTIHQTNRGFGQSANHAIENCAADIVVLLNDDSRIKTDPVPQLWRAFKNPDLFAVTFQSEDEHGRFREGAKRLVWPMGMPRILHNQRDQLPSVNGFLPSAYAVGGHAAFHREKFLALGGFDLLFNPFYWEDVDLCRRAANRGWRTVYLPECRVVHESDGAIRSTFDPQIVQESTMRNRLLFAWRHSPRLYRPFLNLSIAYQVIQDIVFHDGFRNAYQSAKENLANSERLKNEYSE